jgi:hypothetical protein
MSLFADDFVADLLDFPDSGEHFVEANSQVVVVFNPDEGAVGVLPDFVVLLIQIEWLWSSRLFHRLSLPQGWYQCLFELLHGRVEGHQFRC